MGVCVPFPICLEEDPETSEPCICRLVYNIDVFYIHHAKTRCTIIIFQYTYLSAMPLSYSSKNVLNLIQMKPMHTFWGTSKGGDKLQFYANGTVLSYNLLVILFQNKINTLLVYDHITYLIHTQTKIVI